MFEDTESNENKGGCYVFTAIAAFIIVAIFETFWPDVIPFTFLEFWKLEGSIVSIVIRAWPLFLWGAGVSLIAVLRTRNDPDVNRNAETLLGFGFLVSVWAGVVEEISFRWLIFYDEIIGYKILNWLIFGWAGFGVFEWLHLNISGPLANIATFGQMEHLLFNGAGWAVGAAILTSNGKFRDGHVYQGCLGWLNSWFIGMYFFYLMFTYGLIAAIVVHFLYDMIIFTIVYLDAAVERQRGWV